VITVRFLIAIIFAVAAALHAQTPAPANPLLNARDATQLCQRSLQLMEAGGVAVPELQRAAAPVIENARQACKDLETRPNTGQPTYSLLINLRAFLSLSDAVPKPFPFPEAARRQLEELRDGMGRLDAHFRALLDQKEVQIRPVDRDNLRRYAEANRRLTPAERNKPRVVFFGDSITDGWRLNEYFPDGDYVNRGIGGQITAEMLGRMKADVIDLQPAAVLILAGTNDLARGIPLIAIENNYQMIADLASAYKIKVIFASVLPVSDHHMNVSPRFEMTKGRPPVFIKALNEWLLRFCAQRGYTYLNYFDAMVDASGQLQADLADDGLHPNARGYRIMAPLALEAINKTVRPAPVAAPATSSAPVKPTKSRGTSK
jgi:lysophospholipase L1-like esterase